MPTLTSLLARDAVVPLKTIELALQRQVLEGGEIDTSLLEFGAVPENVLSAYRAASFGAIAASRAELESVQPNVLSRVTAEVAREYGVIPIELEDGKLVLASAEPLSPERAAALVKRVGKQIAIRIVTEPRIALSLAQYYGVELSSRLRLLRDRLTAEEPGQVIEVQAKASAPAPTVRPSERPPRAQAKARVASQPGIAVRVVPVVSLGGEKAAKPAPAPAPEPPVLRVAPPVVRAAPPSPAPTRRLSGAPKGPLMQKEAAKRLHEATDRDRVLSVFFSFARQYFEYTFLFAVRDERLLGLEGFGHVSTQSARAIEVPLTHGGSVQRALSERRPSVMTLGAGDGDRALIDALGRSHAQPCVLIPVVIRQRVVVLLYGDRGGEFIALGELAELLGTLPHVSGAFERIIRAHKIQAIGERSPSSQSTQSVVPPQGAFAPVSQSDPRMTPREFAPPEQAIHTQVTSPEGLGSPAKSAGSYRHAPLPPRLPMEAHALIAAADDEQPTLEDDVGSRTTARPSERPVQRSRRERQSTRPLRPSRKSSNPPEAVSDSVELDAGMVSLDAPSPRTLSQPSPGAGSYAMREAQRDVVVTARPGRDLPESQPPRGTQRTRSSRAPGANKLDPRAEAERYVEALMRCAPDGDEQCLADLLTLGEIALPVLVARFPGPIWADRHKARQNTVHGRDVSAIARALYAFEERAIPSIATLTASPSPDTRAYALLLAADRACPELLEAVAKCVHDPEGQVRLQAIAALAFFRDVKGFDVVRMKLRDKAADERGMVADRLAALEAVSGLRDARSIALLVTLNGHRNRQLSIPAHRALVAITAQDFGDEKRKWQTWFDKNRNRHRVEWLIDGLMHEEERVRSIASVELQKLTQVYHGYSSTDPKREREEAQQRYRDWWRMQGRVIHK